MSFEPVTVKSEPEDLDISANIKQEVFDPKIDIKFEFPPLEQSQISACNIKEEIPEESDIICRIKEESDSTCGIEEKINEHHLTDILKVEIRSEYEGFNWQHNNCEANEYIAENSIRSDATENVPEIKKTENIEDACEPANRDDLQDGSLFTIENKRKVTENDTYICYYCGIAFKEKTKLIAHITSHNINEGAIKININLNRTCKFSCLTCDCKFATKSELINHDIRIHDSKINYIACKQCDYKTTINYHLKRHIQTHSGLKPYQCAVCDIFFCTSDTLKVHMRIHSPRPYACTVCDAKFHVRSSLKRHTKIHSREKSYSPASDSKFNESSSLNRHIKIRSGRKSYECTACSLKFSRIRSLRAHNLRYHSTEKPYHCTICDSKFYRSDTLKVHIRAHSGEKSYKCSVCDAKFSRNSSLKEHTRIHSGEKSYKCTLCDAKFSRKESLKKHSRIHSGERPYECTTCDAKFRDSSALKRHSRIHSGDKSYECTACDAKFRDSSSLKRHTKIHSGDKPHGCSACDAKFRENCSLKRHMRIHSRESPHV